MFDGLYGPGDFSGGNWSMLPIGDTLLDLDFSDCLLLPVSCFFKSELPISYLLRVVLGTS